MIAERCQSLVTLLQELGPTAVAFSGGVDSAVVAKAAQVALGDRAIAVTADSPSVPRSELELARSTAQEIGIRHRVIATQEFTQDAYLENRGDRCYHCKSELYSRIEEILPELGVNSICSGANLDDLGDYRPGLIAAAEHQIRHPLQELGFTKTLVREAAGFWNLPVSEKPASPCLSSRIAPGVAVTVERTTRIEQGEALLRELGFTSCRVRLHEGELARIEVHPTEIERLAQECQPITKRFQELGFRFVTLDLEGFRSGNLNVLIPELQLLRRS